MSLKYCVFLAFLASYSPGLLAAAMGIPQNTLKLGLLLQSGFYSNFESEGKTRSTFAMQPINFVVTDWLPNGRKYWLELYYSQISFKAHENHLGESVKQSGAKLSFIHLFNSRQRWHPWLGLGLDLSKIDSSKRHFVDEDGYLIKSFKDNSTYSMSIASQFAAEWHYSSSANIGIKSEYILPVTDSLQSFTLSVYYIVRR